ncbi:Ribosomal protein S18 acetylase RimI [Abditibacterium utsteinense]|uniref:Ribosomal protein S18 acetylase RimI n=1 Tax=Abditibacterium utsteinense TaxID=1960156 RepID=A0A2S8SNU5_9BACT|nr:GNAT family N-acetyltransferase [Abditibacterium utsteinense]PQV62460.1 Ribosomal protein S18 acetylase RimI [Abditibacterium utsteinense]
MIFPLRNHDESLVWEFLCLAAHAEVLSAVQNAPHLARYVVNWGRSGDFGFAACQENFLVGVIWARLFPENEPGFGFVSAEIPEISLAVRQEYRGRGIGRALLQKMKAEASLRYNSLSLSVRDDNIAALRLYQSAGFEKIAGSEVLNRAGGVSLVMQLDF